MFLFPKIWRFKKVNKMKVYFSMIVIIELFVLILVVVYYGTPATQTNDTDQLPHMKEKIQDKIDKTKREENFTKPHILLIVADDLGYNDVGYHGSGIKTPNIDSLAKSGVRLENYYVQPICTPTRGQLLTGRYQIHTGLQWLLWPTTPYGLALENPTIAEKLKEAGYATHIVGKWHLGFHKKEFLPTNRGFDSFFGMLNGHGDYYNHNVEFKGFEGYDLFENDQPVNISKYLGRYSTNIFTEKVKNIIRNHKKGKPLFIYLPYQAVHSPMQSPKRFMDMNENMTLSPRRQYAGMVSCMDDSIGQVVEAMKQRGLWNNTLLIFTSDNGGKISRGGSNWPLRGEKGCLYEGGIRAVGFVHGALIGQEIAGSVSKELMHVTDWFPTLLNLVGGNLNSSKPLDGYDQWPTIRYGLKSSRKEILHDINPRVTAPGQAIYQNTFNTTRRAALRMGDWKIITGHPVSGPQTRPNRSTHLNNLWLINIKLDPREKIDLSERFPDIAQHMLKRLEYYQKGMVKLVYPAADPRADPSLRNGFWQPWL